MFTKEQEKQQLEKRICMVVPTLKQGGMERVMSELVNYADSIGYEVHLILLFKEKIQYSINQSIKIYEPNFSFSNSVVYKIKIFNYLCRNIRVVNPSVLLNFGEKFNLLAIMSCLYTKQKIFISDRSSPLKKRKNIDRLLTNFFYPLADGIIAQTNLAKDIYKKRKYNSNIAAIPNPLRHMEPKSNKGINNIIVSVGRLTKSKNQEELIRIFKDINNLDWKL